MRIGPLELAVITVVAVALLVALWWARSRRPAQLELAELFGEPGPHPGPLARRWALGVLFEAGVDADADRSYAATVLRRAEPRLSVQAAAALVDAVA